MTSEALERIEPRSLAAREELTIEDLLAQVKKIQMAMAKVMRSGEHYGVIPGTSSKPSLFKPGAEKLCLLFRLDPQYHSTETADGTHLTVKATCTLWHIPSGQRMGSGEGSCSTKESKYAYRTAARKCPSCGKEAIVRGKAEYGGGWLCFKKKDGCGAKFKDGDGQIEGQATGRVANEDLADQYNTVLKMANKRALVAAVLNVTAASDIFTQDLEEDTAPEAAHEAAPEAADAPSQEDRPAEVQVQDPAPEEAPRLITEPQMRRFHAIATGAKWTEDQIHTLISGYKYDSSKDIRVVDYNAIVDRLKAGPPKA